MPKHVLEHGYLVLAFLRVRCPSFGGCSSRGTPILEGKLLINSRVVTNSVDVVSKLRVTLVCLVSHG